MKEQQVRAVMLLIFSIQDKECVAEPRLAFLFKMESHGQSCKVPYEEIVPILARILYMETVVVQGETRPRLIERRVMALPTFFFYTVPRGQDFNEIFSTTVPNVILLMHFILLLVKS